ncbi:uncharacterized protein [Triticum aestivum]|uniref:uncharacterized protein isoform X2 n=1 Tax=Triticum aestivum TaxID=4565 RepID=UPI001D0337C2|nr:uncharacterized protein LOC123185314 isoform X2 [Triticum aestivum]
MLLLLVLWVFVRERGMVGSPFSLLPCRLETEKGVSYLEPFVATVLQVLVCMFVGAYLFCLVGMFRGLFLTTNVCVDLGFIDGLPGELPADWTGFPAEVVDNLKVLYSVEFQKRGLPHAHILVWLKGDHSKMEFCSLSQLRQGTTIWRIRVYVSRLWQYCGGTDHGPIKHTDMVLLDAQGNHMYAEVPEKNVDSFIDRIEEGKIYDIRKFLVFPRKYVFRPVEGHSMIKFTKRTELVERTGMEAEFPFCTYALTPIAHLPRPADMPERFIDVIGLVTGISEVVQYVSASRTEPSTKRVIHLKDLTGHQITVILWEKQP